MSILIIKNLNVSVGDKKIIENFNLEIKRNERVLLRGKNGSGKTTLVSAISGNLNYKVEGEIIFDGRDVSCENITTRALMGMFVGSQNVPEIPGLSITSLLKNSVSAHYNFENKKPLPMGQFMQELEKNRKILNIPNEWLSRSVNVGFSGGERKRIMMLRLLMTKPKLAILDEPDSGADFETRELFAKIIMDLNKSGTGFLIISHQSDFSDMIKPTQVVSVSD